MKGIILAGGSGTRLHPLTQVVSKQLLPVYDKPMIYYPLSVLMLSGIRDVLIISTPQDLPNFQRLFGNGEQLGISISYSEQPSPDGLAQAFIIGEDFIGDDDVCLILGDNIFYGAGLQQQLLDARRKVEEDKQAVVFGYYVDDPERYGVAAFDESGKVYDIEEKPKTPKSNYAIVGLYYYPNSVIGIAKNVQPSDRGELEITTVNQEYLNKDILQLQLLGRGFAWLDTGTHESLSEATEFIKTIEKRTSLKVACLEEIALSKGYIQKADLYDRVKDLKGVYFEYLKKISS
ncbi:glucose-1-phosphate thymidylyltransferase [Sphingobacterium cellulitidis]|uniref:glucose-1-phosphate thymidylyltransferase RfbA n=1 Tax=Sphingobacterium cellulitidis TaxID=1768011 RepID=UPI000B93EA97|nr:glucose-1-phosphate thymidylyltransferase RfbA [Sphingobacterium cellulitidis]OYD44463.1 glucose-1-phosphate thymidylyltransferase [Sphingobacterium cellulitidis]